MSLGIGHEQTLHHWATREGVQDERAEFAGDLPPRHDGRQSGQYDATRVIKEILFQEKVDAGANNRNHALRHLDLSWRLREDQESHGGLREVILYGRVARQRGAAETLTAAKDAPPPALLWLGAIPGQTQDNRRPSLEGTMVQDTYVRAIIPVRAKN